MVDTRGSWTEKEFHYRSPELFHELLAATNKTTLLGRNFPVSRTSWVLLPRKLIQYYGRNKILFLRSEDMRPNSIGFMDHFLNPLSAFTGLSLSGFDSDVLQHFTNCGNSKGITKCESHHAHNAYEIAGNRSLLPATRELIYILFLEECKVMWEEFRIAYPSCLNVLDS